MKRVGNNSIRSFRRRCDRSMLPKFAIPNIPLYDSVQITRIPLELTSDAADRSVWGVATWVDVDPSGRLSVRLRARSDQRVPLGAGGDGPEQLTYRTLQLNFWRPGDDIDEHVGEVRNGLPGFSGPALERALKMYGVTEPRLYTWTFQP